MVRRDRVRFRKSADGKEEWIAYMEKHPEISMQARKKVEAVGYLILLYTDRILLIVGPEQPCKEEE